MHIRCHERSAVYAHTLSRTQRAGAMITITQRLVSTYVVTNTAPCMHIRCHQHREPEQSTQRRVSARHTALCNIRCCVGRMSAYGSASCACVCVRARVWMCVYLCVFMLRGSLLARLLCYYYYYNDNFVFQAVWQHSRSSSKICVFSTSRSTKPFSGWHTCSKVNVSPRYSHSKKSL